MTDQKLGVAAANIRGLVVANYGYTKKGKDKVYEILVRLETGGKPVDVKISAWNKKGEILKTFAKGSRVQGTLGVVCDEWPVKNDEGKTNRQITLTLANDGHVIEATDDGDDMNEVNIAGLVTYAGDQGEIKWKDGEGKEKSAAKRSLFVQTPVRTHDGGVAKPSVLVELIGDAAETEYAKDSWVELVGEIRNAVRDGEPKQYFGAVQVSGDDPQIRVVDDKAAA